MKFIEVCDVLKIGHQTIDKQHKVLFEIANKVHDEVHKGFNTKIVIEAMNQLVNYAQNHFSTEENIIEQLGYPEDMLADHKDIHEKLIMDIFKLNEDIATGKQKSMYEIERFLTNWLVLHILIEDMKYKDHLTIQLT